MKVFLVKEFGYSGRERLAVFPEGCALELLGHFDSDGTLTITGDLYQALTPMQEAAFIVHESVYAMARQFSGASDSESSRKLTAYLFATGTTSEELAGLATGMTWDRTNYATPVLLKTGSGNFRLELNNSQRASVMWHFDCLDGMGHTVSSLPHASNEHDPQPASTDAAVFTADLPDGCAVVTYSLMELLPPDPLPLQPVSYKVTYGDTVLASGTFAAETPNGKIPVYYAPGR